jgi:hypothetical protein
MDELLALAVMCGSLFHTDNGCEEAHATLTQHHSRNSWLPGRKEWFGEVWGVGIFTG